MLEYNIKKTQMLWFGNQWVSDKWKYAYSIAS